MKAIDANGNVIETRFAFTCCIMSGGMLDVSFGFSSTSVTRHLLNPTLIRVYVERSNDRAKRVNKYQTDRTNETGRVMTERAGSAYRVI